MQDGVPAPDPDHARRRTPDPSRQHLRHARRGRVPARLHHQRAVLRHRDVLDHRLRRRPRGSARRRRPIDRRSGGPVARRSGPHAARRRARRAPRLHDRSAGPRCHPHPSPRDRAKLGAAAARGVLQDPARRLRREDVPRACGGRAARADFRRAASRRRRAALAVARRARCLSPPFRVDARHA